MYLIKLYDIKMTGNREIVQQRLSLSQTLRYLFTNLTWDGEYF
jgi:hypothetical protein